MNWKVWRVFFEPVEIPALVIGVVFAIASGLVSIIEFVMGTWFSNHINYPFKDWVCYTLVYPGYISIIVGIVTLVFYIVAQLRAHYIYSVDKVYKDEHNIPWWCKQAKEHRLYHVIDKKCPCY